MEILTHIGDIPILKSNIPSLPFNSHLKKLLPEKRKAGILCEVLFWKQVHRGKFHGIDFDRQRIIGNYIVDFYVNTLSLIIEIDGDSHDDKVEYDKIRTNYFIELGLKIFRVGDLEVKQHLDLVLSDLKDYLVREYGGVAIIKGE